MLKLELLLLTLAITGAIGIVSSQHQARKLVTELEREQVRAQQLEVEWGQLQLEQSTWDAHARLEKIARERLGMRRPEGSHIVVATGASK